VVTDVAVEDALMALREHLDDVLAQLDPVAAADLRQLIRQLSLSVTLGQPAREAVVGQMVDLLVQGLPARHPVRRALVRGDLLAPPVLDWDVLAAGLLEQVAADPPAPPGGTGPGPASPDEPLSAAGILRVVTERLLAAPALSESQVRDRGTNPADPALIRLTRPDGGHQWPAFQFMPGNGPHPVVRAINTMLHAARDPVGVADWWLSRNSWLAGRPSELLGRIPDGDLLGAARAIHAEV
jgi:hypothetical protein